MSRLTARFSFVLTDAQRFLILAVLIGVFTGVIVVCFHAAIELVEWGVHDAATSVVARVLLPAIGAALAALVVFQVPAAAGSGIVQTKSALYVSNGRIPFSAVPGKFIACVLSIGTGTPLGPEDPALLMGAGVASKLGSTFGLSRRSMRHIAPVGAAAGIAAAFNTPITGVLFVMEEVVAGWDAAVMGSIVLAAVSSVVTTRLFLGESPLFRVPEVAAIASPREVLLYVALGAASGLFATVYVRGVALLRYRLGAFRLPVGLAPLIAGLAIGGVGLAYPEILGTGYRAMDAALNAQYSWSTMATLAAAKLLVAGLAFAAGTPGGLFAPTLFLGVMLGGAFGGLAPAAAPLVMAPSQSTLALAGMAGVFAGVFRAPMTAVFMTFELSGTSASILPAMITSTLGFLIARQFHRQSILDLVAEHEGAVLPSARVGRAEEPLHVEDALRTDPATVAIIRAAESPAAVLSAMSDAATHVLVEWPRGTWAVAPAPAVTALVAAGTDVRGLSPEAGFVSVGVIYPDELLDVAIRLLARAPVVPVVSRVDEHELLGVVTVADVRQAYRFNDPQAAAPDPGA